MDELNIYQMVFTGSIGLILTLVIGLVLSGLLAWGWRFINRDTSTRPSWFAQRLLDAVDCKDEGAGAAVSVSAIIMVVVPQLLTLMLMYLNITLPIAIGIGGMFLARYVVDHVKLFNKHVKDKDAHKEADDE